MLSLIVKLLLILFRERTTRHSQSVTEQRQHTTTSGHPTAGSRYSMPVEQVTPNRGTSENEVQVSCKYSNKLLAVHTS